MQIFNIADHLFKNSGNQLFGQQAGPAQVATCLLSALHYAAAAWKNNPEVARMLLLHPTMDSANANKYFWYRLIFKPCVSFR